MRNTFISTLFLAALLGACNRAVDPADPLYRTWRWTQTQYNDGRIVDQPTAEFAIVAFRPNGTILYGVNGRYAACCYPNRFRRKGNTLDFTNVKSIPIPPVDNNKCYLVDCLLKGDSWRIITLSNNELILETPSGKYLYQPYP